MAIEERVAELERQLSTLATNVAADKLAFENEVRNRFSTLNTPVWKRLWFRIDGWGPWHTVRERPRWRPWRRWWVS